jgi:hypothetical protein
VCDRANDAQTPRQSPGTVLALPVPAMRTRLAIAAALLVATAGCSSSSSPTTATSATVADFHGQFSGTYTIAQCVDDGSFSGFCQAAGFNSGMSLPIQLTLTQTQSAVSGPITLGTVTGTFTGSVSGGTLAGTATLGDVSSDGMTLNTSVANWSTTITGNALSGGFSIVFRVSPLAGSATISATIAQLNR